MMHSALDFTTIPRLFTALAEWCGCLVAIVQHSKRYTGPKLWGILALALVVQGTFLELTGSLPLVFWIPCMMVAVALMYLWIALCCKIPLRGVAYCTVSSFLVAEFAASLEWQIFSYLAQQHGLSSWFAFWACLVIIYALLFSLSLWMGKRHPENASVVDLQWRELLLPLLIAGVCFLLSNLSFVTSNTPFTSGISKDVYNIRTLVDLAGVAMLHAYHFQRCETVAQREIDAIQSVLRKQYDQYCCSRENIDLIERKYHDLKHQIAVLRAEPNVERRAAYLDQMEEELKSYAATQQTGHPVLDTVLTGKAMQCAANDIAFTCTVDGALLSFVNVMDLCTIFGNLMDNAIEYERTVSDKEKRMIALSVQEKKGLVLVRCENYCVCAPSFHNGLPISTKGDSNYHGFGVKSIRYTTEKYGGSMTVGWKDGWFQVTILLPTPSQN
jgi:two-component sensor histidine kinase